MLTFAGVKAGNNWLKQKVLKVILYAASLPLGMGLSQRPKVSNTWSVIQPQTLDKLKMCQESNNVSATQRSVLPNSLESHLLPCWRNGLKTDARGRPSPGTQGRAPLSPVLYLSHFHNRQPGPLLACPTVWKRTPNMECFQGRNSVFTVFFAVINLV